MPWGTDVYCHLARVWYLAKSFGENGSLPQWFPHWYVGNTLMQYYPPLATYLMVPLQYLSNDINITYRIFVVVCLLFAALATYKLARRWVSPLWAILGAVIYVCAPYTLRTVFSEGHLPRVMAIALTPVIFYLVYEILEGGKRRSFVWLAILSTALVLLHHQHAAVVMICLGIICLGTMIAEKEKRYNSVLAFACMGTGIGIAAWWLLPALTHFDYPTVPDLSIFPERLHLYSINWSAFWPGERLLSIEEIYIGLSIAVLAVLAVLLRRSLRNWLLFGTAVSGIALAFGTNNPVYEFLPMGGFLPERFLNVVTLVLVLLVIEIGPALQNIRLKIPMGKLVRLGCVIIIAIICWADFMPYLGFPRVTQYSNEQMVLASLPVTDDNSRLDVKGTPGGSEWSYLPLEMADIRLAYGWSIETTPHLASIVQHNVALREGFPEYILHNYALWNVRSFIGGQGENVLLSTLESAGFEEVAQPNGLTIMHSPLPAAPVMELKANGIVIGRGAYNAVMAFPHLTLGKEWYLEDYDFDYLSHFDMVYLYDFRYRDRFQFELIVKSLVKQGKMVVLDLTNVPADTPFDITTVYSEVNPEVKIVAPQGSGLPVEQIAEKQFGDAEHQWRGVSYDGLDAVWLTVTDKSGSERPVLGYKQIPEGQVYFLGLNLVGHIIDTNDAATIGFLNGFFDISGVYDDINQPIFATTSYNSAADNMAFSYQSSQDTMVLISETWSAHWRAELDGMPLTIYNHENLMVLSLPSGSHSVTIRYAMTGIQWAGLSITFIFIVMLVVMAVRFNRLPSLYRYITCRIRSSFD